MSIIEKIFPKRYSNYKFLQRNTIELGREVAKWSYDQLNKDAEDQQPIIKTIDGVEIQWQIDCYEKLPNGDLHICIDCSSKIPALFGVLPSYVFIKQRDGSVHL